MKKRTGTYGIGFLLAAGAVSVSCGDDGNGGTATAGTASGGAAIAGSPAGGTSSGNGSGGSNAGSGGKAAAGDANLGGGAAAGEANAGGNDGNSGGAGDGDNGGAPASSGGEAHGGVPGTAGGAPPEPMGGTGPSVDGGAGGAGGAPACLAVDEQPCQQGVDAACTNDEGQLCFCFGQSDEWNCIDPGGQGGAGPGFGADCGDNPANDADCDGFGQCEENGSCFCVFGNVVCQ